jgi:hypothetical protein
VLSVRCAERHNIKERLLFVYTLFTNLINAWNVERFKIIKKKSRPTIRQKPQLRQGLRGNAVGKQYNLV